MGMFIINACKDLICDLIFSNSFVSVMSAGIRRRPRWHPEGGVDVDSFHFRNPLTTSSGERYVSISGSYFLFAI
jgi:hypothetical protein